MIRRPVRVLMVWSHRALGEAVAASLAARPGMVVVGAVGSADEAARVLAAERADVALLDASVDVGAARELAARLQEEFPRLRVLSFGVPSHEAAVTLIEAGAAGYVSSAASLDELAEAILETGGRPAALGLAAEVAARIEELSARADPAPAVASVDPLSERELEVLVLLARGLGNKEIARRLDIRTSTVKNHVHSILSKLGVPGRRQAVRRAYEQGLLRGPLRWRTLDDEE